MLYRTFPERRKMMVEVYQSGWLVLGFVSLCAIIIIGQLIPAILLLIGAIKALKKED
jgi:hypothetical protein